ncbi:J domain-containing protein [Geobacter sulfurreducens]|uniref:J domain-containing protein n=1 Tax=Geobacter sulfurreducens TaxID=35554 RepID=UPI002CCB4DAE|nr:J domain-containing protein [Geobacter sulfurreducens]HML77563.1 J domain-containing protein [Geobacter sulfurreducens]
MDDLRDCYGLLGLSPGASADEAKRAYRVAVSACHPDHFVNDPVRRRNAEERLRLIIEAYHRIDACRKPGPDTSANSRAGLQAGGWPAGRRPGFPRSSLATFPNGLFLLLCVVCAVRFIHLYGATASAALAALELLLVPLLFGAAHNLIIPTNRLVRNLYGAFTVCFLLVVIAGAVAARYDSSLPFPASFEYSDGSPASSVPWPATNHDRPPAEPVDGPTADTSPYRRGVHPPHSPHAPAVPVAPVAPAAPLVPPAR